MTDKIPVLKKGFSADWFMRGALTKIGDTIDRFTGRKWTPSSSLATSELIERLKRLLDAEVKHVEGKGPVVPHNIKLKMQWDKFSSDSEDALARLETELLAAAADHINDKLYYTYAPLTLKVIRDYFIEGVKLNVSFDDIEENEAELNVTMPLINVKDTILAEPSHEETLVWFVARHKIKGVAKQKTLSFPVGGRISVGRTGGSDLVLDDISVSKIHASIAADDEGGLIVADTGSTNGTFINGKRIPYGTAMPLAVGDKVKFGVVEVEFELIDSAAVLGHNTPKVPEMNDIPVTPEIADPTASKTFEIKPDSDDPAIPDTLLDISEEDGPVSNR
jgi:hypothetical protein